MRAPMDGRYQRRWEALKHYVGQLPEAAQERFIADCEQRFADGFDRSFIRDLEDEVERWMYAGAGPVADDGDEPLDQSVEWDVFYMLAVSELLLEDTLDDLRDQEVDGSELELHAADLVEAPFTWMWETFAELAKVPVSLVPVLMLVAEGPLLRPNELLAQARRLTS